MSNVNYVTFTIVLVVFLIVTLTGFAAARWRRAESMMNLDEWGLGGRSFGTFIAWFLLGGDLYTAYTFIAVPAAVFGAGAVTGFFAVSYTIIVFPIALIFLPGCGRSPGRTTTSRPRTSSAAGTGHAACRWPWPSPASWP